MRFLIVVFLLAAITFLPVLTGSISSNQAVAQQKYLVSPTDDFIPITKGTSAVSILQTKFGRDVASAASACTDQAMFGYPPSLYPSTVNHVGRHKDVMGMWFVAKATGTIDTLFWNTLSTIGALDSQL